MDFRVLPSVDSVLSSPRAAELLARFPRAEIVESVRRELERVRDALRRGGSVPEQWQHRDRLAEWVLGEVERKLAGSLQPSLRRVINATGIILHTNLGRAPLPEAARKHLLEVAGYCSLEVDLEKGERGDRLAHLEPLLCSLTRAEAAVVVNNNAAAVLLALNTLAKGREVIVSRGQLIEIGGSFRLPEVMEKSGAIMVEVGTTNKTRASDYAEAITERTAAILLAHPSNYRVLGFTEEPELAEVVRIAHSHGLPVIHDLGGGILFPFERYGLPHEPVVQESLEAGVDVVTFSGDKVIGGPQSGIIVGRRELLQKMRRNPLMRALRCDKLILAALQSTLQLFRDERWLRREHPVFRMLTEPLEHTEMRAVRLARRLRRGRFPLEVELVDSLAEAGSGTLPLAPIRSKAVRIRHTRLSSEELARALRLSDPPVVPYQKDGWVYLDCRTVADEDLDDLVRVLRQVCARQTESSSEAASGVAEN